MKLKVLEPAPPQAPWFADGLRFTCSQCGNCCTGGPGFVWISRVEIAKLAEFLHLSRLQVIRRYCRKVGRRFSLKEMRNSRTGGFDCVFIRELPGVDGAHARRICSIYEARPLQCRTWPFWEGNLATRKAWHHASRTCLGMNSGRFFSRNEIEKLRDAQDWPRKPPTS
jgi:Fe-S-cluster containining protein